jgi:hypothetical protein
MILRPGIVFLSSTFIDLKFERRFVAKWLAVRGLQVITMEQDCPPGCDWYRWSLNRAGQCDILLRLRGHRLGHKGPWRHTGDMTNSEGVQAWPALTVSYQLKRPFPDASVLCDSPDEVIEYEQSLEAKDARGWDPIEADIFRGLPTDETVCSVGDLASVLERDVKLPRWRLVAHRFRRWRRRLYDTNEAAWWHAYEDESSQAATSRAVVLKRLRVPLTGAAAVIVSSLYWLPLLHALPVLGAGVTLGAVIALATGPSYVWIGTKTIVARGLFGLRTSQESRRGRVNVVSHWALTQRWWDVGAMSVKFSNGSRIFVPFIRTADALASEASKEPLSRTVNPREEADPPEVIQARFEEFMKELRDDEEELGAR